MAENTPEAKRLAERERAARRRRANDRLAALSPAARDAVRQRAQRLEAHHKGPRVTAVAWLEQALDLTEVGATKAAPKPDPQPRRPKGPREKSTPKEAGRPKPEHKDTDALARNAATERGGEAAIAATVTVEVSDGLAYCARCDTKKPESLFWPAKRTAKSKRRKSCRPCFNDAWAEWDRARRAAAAVSA